jgi:hypothetical protein
MGQMSVSAAVRQVLARNIDMPGEELLKEVRKLGINAEKPQILSASYNIRGLLRKAAAGAVAEQAPKPVAAPTNDHLQAVVSVAKLIDACGGVENVEKVVEQVRAMGSAEKLLSTVEVVKAVRGTAREPRTGDER